MKAAAIVVVAAAIALGAQGFTFEIEIAGPAADPLGNLGGTDSSHADHLQTFLTRMRKHMKRVAEASQHVYAPNADEGSPLEGLIHDVHKLFEGGHVPDSKIVSSQDQDPLSKLHEVAHHTVQSETGLKHADFTQATRHAVHRQGPGPMLQIMQMIHAMTQPLLQAIPQQRTPPRGLVALACHRDAVTYCQKYCSCWRGMTQCLKRHQDDIAPRCSHLLALSGVLREEESVSAPEQDESEATTKPSSDDDESDEMPSNDTNEMSDSTEEPKDTDDQGQKASTDAAKEKDEDSTPSDAEALKTAITPSIDHKSTEVPSAEAPKAKGELKEGKASPQQPKKPLHPLLSQLQAAPLSMRASLQKLHHHLSTEITSTKKAIEDDQAPPKAENHVGPKQNSPEKPKAMAEATPAYLTGDVEPPKGEKDMGGWKMRSYTPEQQKRLGVDEQGRPQEEKRQRNQQQEGTTQSSGTSKPGQHSLAGLLHHAQGHLLAAPSWLLALCSGLFLALLCSCLACHRRRRAAAALQCEYARLTTAESTMRMMGSHSQL